MDAEKVKVTVTKPVWSIVRRLSEVFKMHNITE